MVAQLEALGAQLKWMDDASMSGGIGGMFWRFLVAADRDVDRFIIRDSDSRLNPRERCAIATECLSNCLSECLTECLTDPLRVPLELPLGVPNGVPRTALDCAQARRGGVDRVR